MDLSNYTEEELLRMREAAPDAPEEPSVQQAQPQAEPEDPDAELKRRFAYVAERSDNANERRMAQNAVNWLNSNKSASLDDGGEKLRAYADHFYTGTKERTNDFTKEERRQRYADRYEQAKQLTDMAQFVVDENGDDERYQRDTRQAKNLLNFLTNHTSKFDALGDADVAELSQRVMGMYDAAAGRRGHLRKFWDALMRGHDSLATMTAQGFMMMKPGELTTDDLETIRNLQSERERRDVARPKVIGSVRDIKSGGDVLDYVLEATGENIERMAVTALGATAGAMMGGVPLAIAGASAAGMAMNTGEAVGDQVDEGLATEKNFSRALALGQGFGYSIVDGAFGMTPLLGKVGSGILKSIGRVGAKTAATALREGAKAASFKHAVKEVAKGAVGEAIQEPGQSSVIGRGRRWIQTGSPLREGETPEDAAWEAVDEAAGAFAASLLTGGGTVALNTAGARRRLAVTDRLANRLIKDEAFNSLSGEHRTLIARHLINDSLLATDTYAPVLTEEDRAALTRQNKDIEDDLKSDNGKGADNARKMLASITSDYAMEDKATIVEAARKANTLRQIDVEALRATEREIEAPSDSERVYAYYDKNTNQHLYRITDGKDEVWLTAPNPLMKPAADGQTAFLTLKEALNAMSENDAYNRARAEHSASKREVIKRAVQNLYGGEVNLVLADGVGGIADEGLRAEMESAGPGVKAGYSADRNTLVVIPSNINSLGELYTTLAHEAKHREIANNLLGKGETVEGGRKRLFGGKANKGAEKFAEHYGTSLEEANEEVAVERASVEDIVKAVRDADRTLVGAGVQRVFDAVRKIMGANMGVSERVITDADVRAELRYLWNAGYLGGTKTADAKVTLTEDSEHAVQQGEQERFINDSAARESERQARIRRADEAAQRAAHEERGAQIAEAFAQTSEKAHTSVPSAAETQTAAPATESVEAASRAAGGTNQESAAPEVPVAENQETQTKENDNEARSVADEKQAKPEQWARSGEQAAEVRQGRVPEAGEVAPAEEGARSAVEEPAEQPPAAKPAVFTEKDGTTETIDGYVAPTDGDLSAGRKVVVQHDTGGGINARQKIFGTVKSVEGNRVTVDYEDGWGNPQTVTFDKSEIVGVKPAETSENAPASVPKDAAATAPTKAKNAPEGKETPNTAKPTEPPSPKPSAEDAAYQAWLAKYRLKDTPKRRKEWEKKRGEAANAAPTEDRQGNPVNADGSLKVEAVKSVAEMTDEDFTAPKRNVQLPQIPANVDAAIGAEGKPVIIKRNIFQKNASHHPELNAETSRGILERSLYNPNLVGQSQPVTKPNYRVAVRTGDKNAVTILDVHQNRENVEIVGWRNIDEKGLERLKRQAVREGGQFLILRPSEEGQPGALSGRPNGSTANSIPQAGAEKQAGAETAPTPVADDGRIHWIDRNGSDRGSLPPEYVKPSKENVVVGADAAIAHNAIDTLYAGKLVSVGPKNVKIKTSKGQTLTFPRSEIIGISNEASRTKANLKATLTKDELMYYVNKRVEQLASELNLDDRDYAEAGAHTPEEKAKYRKNLEAGILQSDSLGALHEVIGQLGWDNRKTVAECIKAMKEIIVKPPLKRDGVGEFTYTSLNRLAHDLYTNPHTTQDEMAWLEQYMGSDSYRATARSEAESRGKKLPVAKKPKKPRKKLPPNERPGWNVSYNAFAETSDDQFAGEIIGVRKEQGYLLRRPTKDCPLWDWYQNHKDDRSAMLFLFGTAKSGVNDSLETLEDLSFRENLLEQADRQGFDSVADTLLDAYRKYKAWKDNGGVEGAQRAQEERAAYEAEVEQENRFGDDAAFEEYALDDLETRENWDKEYAEAVGFVENENTGEEMKFSPESLAKAELGKDVIRVDHHDKTFLFVDWDAENGILTVIDVDRPVEDSTIRYRVSEDGVQEIRKATDNGQRNEEGTADDRASDAQGEGNAAEQGERGEAGGGGESLRLEAATAEELTAEAEQRRQAAEIARRQAAPLKGGTGEVGQSLLDLGGAEGEDLFNRTERTQKPAAPSHEAAVKAMRTLGMDSALSDAQLRAKMREWQRHADDPRFKARLDAAEVLLADRAAKGKAELTDEDKAMQRILGMRFKRGAESREYEDVVRRYHNADGTTKRGWMLAPNGKPTKLTERQWVQVRTPSFKRWFGDWENDPANASKVVDENGEPMPVYHGSERKFWAFATEKIGSHTDSFGHDGVGVWGRGHYFSDKKDIAESYQRGNPDGQVIDGYLNIRNPMPKEEVLRCGRDAWEFTDSDGKNFYREYQRLIDESLRKNGYDGVVADGKYSTEYVVFASTQIKSATENTGAFDPQNPDIRYKRGEHEKQTALSGGTSRNQNPAGNEYGKKWGFFRRGTRNIDIGAGRFDKATQFLADLGVVNIPFDPVNRDSETNRRAAEGVRENPADTATVHNVLNVIDNDSVMDGIINQAARGIKKNGAAIFTVYEGDRSGNGKATRDGYQRNAKASAYVPHIAKYFGSVEAHGNVILARKPKDVGPAFWAFDSSFDNGIRFKRSNADDRYGIGSSAVNGEGFADLEAGDTYENVFKSLTSRTNEEVHNERLGITAKIGSNRNANHLVGKNSAFGDEDAEAHKYAAKNVLALLAKADVGILHRDKKGTRNDYIRAFAPFAFGDEMKVATITLRRESVGDRIYTVEAVEVESGDSPRTSRLTAQEAQSPVSLGDRIAYYVGDVKATEPKFLGSETPFSVDELTKRVNESVASFRQNTERNIRFKRSGLYTGSAADYERPSLHAVGTGEGAQVYGWGLYASTKRGVAEKYAKVGASIKESLLVPEHAQKNGKDIRRYDPAATRQEDLSAEMIVGEAITAAHGDLTKAKEFVESYARQSKEQYDDSSSPYNKQILDNARKAIAEIDEHGDEYGYVPQVGRKPSQGYVYEQTFFTDRAPGDESHLLNWYEPVSKENLKRIEEHWRKEHHGSLFKDRSYRTADEERVSAIKSGRNMYSLINAELRSPKLTSKFLARAGIDGVKYPVDSYGKTLKDGDKAGWNYVSFRDDNITVDHKWRDGNMLFKRGEPNLPRATEDDPNVAFGTKEGIFQKTGIERDFARVSDVAVMKEGERRSRIVGEADGIIRKVRSGDAPSSTDLATLIHAYADRLAELDRARNAGEDTEMLEKAIANVAEGLRLAGNRSGRALQMLKIGVGLSGVRDTYHYLESEVKAIKRKQGLDDKLTDSERKMLEAQAAQLKEVNDKLNAELAKVNERNADLETMNRQLMELRRQMTRRIDRAVKEKYGIVHEDAANSAFAGLGKFFRRTPNAVMKRGEATSSSLNDEMRGYFSQALYAVGMDEAKARSLLNDNFGEDAASKFDSYLAELGETSETRSAKSEDMRKRTRIVPDAESVRGKSRLDRLREATVANLDALGEDADADAKHRAMAKYLRDFMKYVAKSEPSLTNEEVLSRMADEARLLDPEGEYDAQSMLSVVTGKDGFDMETRAKVNERVKTLEKALELARQGKLTEAAELAGIPYVSDVTLLENYESDLRQQLADDTERLLELTDAPPVGEEARVEEINALKERIKQTRAEIAKLRKEGSLAEKREAAVKALKEKLAVKEAELAELAGKPIADADAAKAEVRSLRRRISALAKEQRVIETLRGQIAEMDRRIRENDFEAAPRETQTAEQSPEVKRLIAERQRMRERFAAARRAHQYKQMGVAGQLAKDLWQILGETKGLVGSLDLSSMFRQGGQLTFAHPLIFARNFGKTLNALKSAENAQALMDEIMSRPNAPYYAKAGIDFTDWGTGAINPDDRFAIYDNDADGRWLLRQFRKVTKNRLVKAGVESSERAFSMYLNLMRADVFDAMIAGSTFGSPANMTQSQLEAVGRHLNIASQRGAFDRNGNLGKAVNFLNGFLWSPRNLISRFQFLAETAKLAVPGANPYGDKTLRGMFAKELARYLTGVAAITVFAKTLSDLLRDDDEPEEDIELDPRSSQFLRVKFGETRMEFLSGLAQIITFLSRLGTRQSKTARGQMREISPTDALGRFLRTKYSPGASLVWDVATRESFSKQDLVFDSLWKSDKDEKAIYRHVAESFVPLTITDVWDQLKYSGLKKTAVTTIATLLGAGVNTYDPKTYKQLKGDFTYFRNLYAEADADGRNELMRKCPFLRRTAEIEAAIKAVKEAEKYARQIEKQGGTVGEGLAETILRRRQRVIDLMTAGGNQR